MRLPKLPRLPERKPRTPKPPKPPGQKKAKKQAPASVPGVWTPPGWLQKTAAGTGIIMTAIAVGTTAIALSESYHNLYEWALGHDYSGLEADFWPGIIDTFMVMSELGMIAVIAMNFRLSRKAHAFLWALIVIGLGVSIAANMGSLPASATVTDRLTHAAPPVAAWAALSVAFFIFRVFVSWLIERDKAAEQESTRETAGTADEPVIEAGTPVPSLPFVPLPLRIVRKRVPEPAPAEPDPIDVEALLRAMQPVRVIAQEVPGVLFAMPDIAPADPGRIEVPIGFDPWMYGENAWSNPGYRALSRADRVDFALMKAEHLWGEDVRTGRPVPGIKVIKPEAGVGDDLAGLMRDYLRGQAPAEALAA